MLLLNKSSVDNSRWKKEKELKAHGSALSVPRVMMCFPGRWAAHRLWIQASCLCTGCTSLLTMLVVLTAAGLWGLWNTRAMCHITRTVLDMDKTTVPPVRRLKGLHFTSHRTILSCFLFLSPRETDTCSHTHGGRADPYEVPKYGEQKVCRRVKGEAEQKTNK